MIRGQPSITKKINVKSYMLGLLLLGIALTPAQAKDGTIPVKDGETIAFLGDSITAEGRREDGYCQLVLQGLRKEGIETTAVFSGNPGNTSKMMLRRLERDIISRNPDWMILSCGVNDVAQGDRGVDLENYKRNIAAIVEKARAAGIKIMLLTSTMITEDQQHESNQKLKGYNAYLRELAKTKSILIADLNAEMQNTLQAFPADAPKGKRLTRDGVHMNVAGNRMMARGILKAFGIPEANLPVIIEQE